MAQDPCQCNASGNLANMINTRWLVRLHKSAVPVVVKFGDVGSSKSFHLSFWIFGRGERRTTAQMMGYV
jgi:hypothetical protein